VRKRSRRRGVGGVLHAVDGDEAALADLTDAVGDPADVRALERRVSMSSPPQQDALAGPGGGVAWSVTRAASAPWSRISVRVECAPSRPSRRCAGSSARFTKPSAARLHEPSEMPLRLGAARAMGHLTCANTRPLARRSWRGPGAAGSTAACAGFRVSRWLESARHGARHVAGPAGMALRAGCRDDRDARRSVMSYAMGSQAAELEGAGPRKAFDPGRVGTDGRGERAPSRARKCRALDGEGARGAHLASGPRGLVGRRRRVTSPRRSGSCRAGRTARRQRSRYFRGTRAWGRDRPRVPVRVGREGARSRGDEGTSQAQPGRGCARARLPAHGSGGASPGSRTSGRGRRARQLDGRRSSPPKPVPTDDRRRRNVGRESPSTGWNPGPVSRPGGNGRIEPQHASWRTKRNHRQRQPTRADVGRGAVRSGMSRTWCSSTLARRPPSSRGP
jgi:hypothetical protein